MADRLEFFLYSRATCHLCHDFHARLDALLSGHDYQCHVLDVDTDPALTHRYGARLPVLVADGVEVCEQHFDAGAIQAFVRQYLERN